MSKADTLWIEQDAIDKWWNKHRLELRKAVTVERVRLQKENEELKKWVQHRHACPANPDSGWGCPCTCGFEQWEVLVIAMDEIISSGG